MKYTRDYLLRPNKLRVKLVTLTAIGCGMVSMGTAPENEPENVMQRVGMIGIPADLTDQGFETTGFNTDIAIAGGGFLKVQLERDQGSLAGYTRYGSLFLNQSGRLGVCLGDKFYPLDPPIQLPAGAGNIAIKIDGTVRYTLAGSTPRQADGRILIWRFADPSGLILGQDHLCLETDASGPATRDLPGHHGAGYLQPGYLEKADADPLRPFPPNDGM